MAYRNDMQALEARRRALDLELAASTRERHEVARTLARARDAQDRLDGGPERRTRNRRIAISMIATTMVVVAGVAHSMVVHHRTRAVDAELARLSSYADKMCRCTTWYCAEDVNDETERWAARVASHTSSGSLDSEGTRRFVDVSQRYAECFITLQTM